METQTDYYLAASALETMHRINGTRKKVILETQQGYAHSEGSEPKGDGSDKIERYRRFREYARNESSKPDSKRILRIPDVEGLRDKEGAE